MNKENIQKGIDYLEANYDDISKRFNMDFYRNVGWDELSHVCGTSGCLVGHLTAIDAEGFYKYADVTLCFKNWSEKFFDVYDKDWSFMFSNTWGESPETNTLQQGINRMKYMLKHEQRPKDWKYLESDILY